MQALVDFLFSAGFSRFFVFCFSFLWSANGAELLDLEKFTTVRLSVVCVGCFPFLVVARSVRSSLSNRRLRDKQESPGAETPWRSSYVATTDFPVHLLAGGLFGLSPFTPARQTSRQSLSKFEDPLTRTAFCGGRQARPSIVQTSSGRGRVLRSGHVASFPFSSTNLIFIEIFHRRRYLCFSTFRSIHTFLWRSFPFIDHESCA